MSTDAPESQVPRVVVVDDDESVRTAIAGLLAACGIEIAGVAPDGEAGVELVARTRPDVVVMDLRMPRLDGAAATELIRAHDETVQVVLLSAYDDPSLVTGAKLNGAYAYLVKGCAGSLVVDVVTQAFALASGLRSQQSAGATADDGSLRVVIADDVVTVRDSLTQMLKAAKLSVVGAAADGRDALRLAVELQPDVLVVDLRMPGLDGITVATHVKALAPHVAVVLYSGHTDAEFVDDAYRAGVDGFVEKGAPVSEIITVVRQAVARQDEPS
jgi:DNA-binding NarL/FixJ family response regulator